MSCRWGIWRPRIIHQGIQRTLLCGLLGLLGTTTLPGSSDGGEPLWFDVGFDRWMYPFNGTPGTRVTGSVFGALGEPDFDDRDAQLLFGFPVGSPDPADAGRPIQAVTLFVTTAAERTFTYDPTGDSLASYQGTAADDPGRPLELFGVGTRFGFTQLSTAAAGPSDTFLETSPYAPFPGRFHEARSAYAADFQDGVLSDVSNNVRTGWDAQPWAIGTTDAVNPGQTVPMDVEFRFALDLDRPEVREYVRAGWAAGELFFALTSLQTASLNGPPTFPSFYLDAGGIQLGPTARLEIELGNALPGDFDGNGTLEVADLEQLNAALRAGDAAARYDLDQNQQVNDDDRSWFVHTLWGTWYGDANLDGEFNSSDLVQVLTRGEYENSVGGDSDWSDGDWNGDGDFTSSDLVTALVDGGYESGGRAARPAPVPEPSSFLPSLLMGGGLWVHRRRRP